MPNIDWSKDFRLAVIERIGLRFTCFNNPPLTPTDFPPFAVFAVVANVARADADFLNSFPAYIESALDCTLEEVQRELQNDS